jgi:hypothetical protein
MSFLVGCSSVVSKDKVYSSGEFNITVPQEWFIESESEILPENVIVSLLYKDIKNNDVYTVNVIKEPYLSQDVSFMERSLGMVNSSEGYELLDEDNVTISDNEGLLHSFNLSLGEEQKKIMQLYVYNDINKHGYVVTAIMPIRNDNAILEATVEKIIKSFIFT